MANSSALATILVCRLLSILCFFTACTVVSAQGDSDATPSQAELAHARQLIRETPCPGDPGNPVRVIRSVNCLRALGKKQAIALLFEVASVSNMGRVVSKESDVDDSVPVGYDQTIFMIIPLLFDVPENGTPPPEPWYSTVNKTWQGVAGTQVIQGDIPFAISGQWTYGGSPYSTRPLVEWAAEHGRMRAKGLVPQDDLLEAAEALHRRISARTVTEFEEWLDQVDESARDRVIEGLKSDLRSQAVRMLHNGMRDLKVLPWEELRHQVEKRGIHWDSKIEAHMLSGSRSVR
jgi:hypothetical protein